jgi:predicted aldo/keto reductase-like oxidoreductase
MENIRLGRTNMLVSRLGFGGIPIQRLSEADAVAVVQKCLELGITFIDTANGYSTSEERIGKAVQGRREGLYIATKTMARTPEEIEKHLHLSLQRLGTAYIDLYQFHGVNDFGTLKQVLASDGPFPAVQAAQRAGQVRHIGITSHQIDVAKEAVKSDRFETIMFPFNFITDEAAIELLPLARQHDVGFIAMKPLAGGMLGKVTLAFKYLFQFPDVLSIPGIEKESEIEEIVRLLEGPLQLTGADNREMQQLKTELGTKFCRRCDYCQPCTAGIKISLVLTSDTLFKRLPREGVLKGPFAAPLQKAADCIGCGECETRCPFQLPIREIMAQRFKFFQEEQSKYQERP